MKIEKIGIADFERRQLLVFDRGSRPGSQVTFSKSQSVTGPVVFSFPDGSPLHAGQSEVTLTESQQKKEVRLATKAAASSYRMHVEADGETWPSRLVVADGGVEQFGYEVSLLVGAKTPVLTLRAHLPANESPGPGGSPFSIVSTSAQRTSRADVATFCASRHRFGLELANDESCPPFLVQKPSEGDRLLRVELVQGRRPQPEERPGGRPEDKNNGGQGGGQVVEIVIDP